MQRVGLRVPEDLLLELRFLLCASQVRIRVDWFPERKSPVGDTYNKEDLVAHGNPYVLARAP